MENLETRLKNTIDSELKKCSQGLYPKLCRIRDSKVGLSRIYSAIRAMIVEKPMDIKSALAQYESSI